MILDSTLKLEMVLAGVVAANQPFVHVDYFDWNQQGQRTRPATFRVSLNSNTDVTVLPAPAAGFTREPMRWSVYNKDTAAITVTVKTDDGSTEGIINKTDVPVGRTLSWDANAGYNLG